jgi:hypothetical protein
LKCESISKYFTGSDSPTSDRTPGTEGEEVHNGKSA